MRRRGAGVGRGAADERAGRVRRARAKLHRRAADRRPGRGQRGERKTIDFGSACATGSGKAQRHALRLAARFRRARRGYDRYCVRGGGQLRIGYPTRFLNARIAARQRRRVRSRAILAISSSKRFRIRGVRVGAGVRTLRRRLRGERRVRVSRDVWYHKRAGRATLVFKTRGGRVRELGVADRQLTSARRGARRLLRSYRGGRQG